MPRPTTTEEIEFLYRTGGPALFVQMLDALKTANAALQTHNPVTGFHYMYELTGGAEAHAEALSLFCKIVILKDKHDFVEPVTSTESADVKSAIMAG